MTTHEFLARFDKKKPTGGQWLVQCPAHEDREASLAVREGPGGRTLLNCHGGCETSAILSVMQLTAADLFADSRKRDAGPRREVARYAYTDEGGQVLFEVVRTKPKAFYQQRPDGNGGSINKLGDVRRVLYGLPQLRGATCFVVEGEKDVESLRKLGICATTNAGGAGKWRPEYAQQLTAARIQNIVVSPDNDDSGRQHAAVVAHSCHAAGLNVKVIALPGVPHKGDISDYIAAGHTRADIMALVQAASVYSPPSPDAIPKPQAFGPVVQCVADVQSERVSWLWRRRFARGKLTLLMGDPGVGKSFITIDATSRVTRGGTWPDGDDVGTAGNVLFLAVEDGIGDTIRPRLERAGADLSRVFVLTTVRDETGDRMPDFEQDMAALEQVIVERNPVLVVVDPVSSYLGKSDSYKDTEIRRVLTPLVVLAERQKVALVALVHMTKGSKEGKALYRAMGSIAFAALARVVLAAGSDPEVESRCYLMPVKQNICPPSATLAYSLRPDADDVDGPARLEWEQAAVEGVRANVILGASGSARGDREQQQDAADFLRQLLADGRMRSEDVYLAGDSHGYSKSTLNRSKKRAGVKSTKVGAFSGGSWFWELEAPKATTQPDVTTFATKQAVSAVESTSSSKIVTVAPVTTFEPEDDEDTGLV